MSMSINDKDTSQAIQERVVDAFNSKQALCITGSDSKRFYGNEIEGKQLDVTSHTGVIEYEPSELVLTARAGTRLADIEMILSDAGQMLAFEPPYFGLNATLGGTVACGFSGPRRPFSGSVRDSVLGTSCINGRGESLKFGGKVIKNVAGYDASRLMVGALGTLGVILDVSLKVLPKPELETTMVLEENADAAITFINTLASLPVPLSAAAYVDGKLFLRLSGSEAAVRHAVSKMDKPVEQKESGNIWLQIKEHTHAFFATDLPVWRLSILPGAPMLALPGEWLIDWAGAQRWLKTEAAESEIRHAVDLLDGHATLFKNKIADDNLSQIFHPLSSPMAVLHKKMKTAFDPECILNRNKMYKDIC